MGKSLEFVKQRIASRECKGMENNVYTSMYQTLFPEIIKQMKFGGNIKFRENKWENNFLVKFKDGTERELNTITEYNPDAEFEYFTMERCACDGTFVFYFDLCARVLSKVFTGETCNKSKLPDNFEDIMSEYTIKYTVGDFVFGEEYGEEFATEEKPWMQSRFSVMLPIRCDFIKR